MLAKKKMVLLTEFMTLNHIFKNHPNKDIFIDIAVMLKIDISKEKGINIFLNQIIPVSLWFTDLFFYIFKNQTKLTIISTETNTENYFSFAKEHLELIAHVDTLESISFHNLEALTDKILHMFKNISKISLSFSGIQGKYFYDMKNLKVLNLKSCPFLKNESLKELPKLEELTIINCPNITGEAIENLTNLKLLNFQWNKSPLKNKHIWNLLNLLTLKIRECKDLTDESISRLTNLQLLEMRSPYSITKKCISSLKYLKIFTILDYSCVMNKLEKDFGS